VSYDDDSGRRPNSKLIRAGGDAADLMPRRVIDPENDDTAVVIIEERSCRIDPFVLLA